MEGASGDAGFFFLMALVGPWLRFLSRSLPFLPPRPENRLEAIYGAPRPVPNGLQNLPPFREISWGELSAGRAQEGQSPSIKQK